MTKDEALNHALQLVSNLRTHSWTVADTQFVITAIKQALANEALERKAENARELGLNYEPVAYVKTVIEALYENSDPVSVEAAELLERIITSPPVAEPHKRKPLTGEMTKQMRDRCDSYEMRGAFVDGWLSAEAAHGIYAPTERKGEA